MNQIQNRRTREGIRARKIVIFLMLTNIRLKQVRVNSSDPINVVFKFLPAGNNIVFYHGNLINSKNSFQSYGITDYDRIAITNENQMTFQFEFFWKKVTQIDIERTEILENYQDSLVRREILRHQDLLLLKTENHPRNFHYFIKYFQILTLESDVNEVSTSLNWKRKEKPNESSLPNLW
jgi:hypothetical protein